MWAGGRSSSITTPRTLRSAGVATTTLESRTQMPKNRGGTTVAPPPTTPAPPPPAQLNTHERTLYQGLQDASAAAVENPQAATTDTALLSELAASPVNPKHRFEATEQDLNDILPSIREIGVVQPLIVATRGAVLEATPRLADRLKPEIKYVILGGHRRVAAARFAGLTNVPISVRDDLAPVAGMLRVFLAENSRTAITELEEAEAYRQLKDDEGMTERQIADFTGKSQPTVHKRIALTRLDDAVKQALQHRLINVTEAGRIGVLKQHRDQRAAVEAIVAARKSRAHSDEPGGDVEDVVTRALQGIAQAEQLRQLQQQLSSNGLAEIDPAQQFGDDAWKHELKATEVDAEREAGNLAGARIDGTRIIYYSISLAPELRKAAEEEEARRLAEADDSATPDAEGEPQASGGEDAADKKSTASARPKAAPKKTRQPPRMSAAEKAAQDALYQQRQQHIAAAEKRHEACRTLLADFTTVRQNRTLLLDTFSETLLGVRSDDTVFRLAQTILDWTGTEVRTQAELDAVLTDRPAGQKLAMASALAALEDEAKQIQYASGRAWPKAICRHIRRLAEAGYHTLSDYERTKLETDDPS